MTIHSSNFLLGFWFLVSWSLSKFWVNGGVHPGLVASQLHIPIKQRTLTPMSNSQSANLTNVFEMCKVQPGKTQTRENMHSQITTCVLFPVRHTGNSTHPSELYVTDVWSKTVCHSSKTCHQHGADVIDNSFSERMFHFTPSRLPSFLPRYLPLSDKTDMDTHTHSHTHSDAHQLNSSSSEPVVPQQKFFKTSCALPSRTWLFYWLYATTPLQERYPNVLFNNQSQETSKASPLSQKR